MSKCCNETLLKNIGIEKLIKSSKVTFNLLYDFPDCRGIVTGDVVQYNSATVSYDKLDRPDDALECSRNNCVNTGTLTVTKSGNEGSASVIFKAPFDMTELATGLMTFYTKTDVGGMGIYISADASFTDADYYEVNLADISPQADGFKLAMVDFSSTPENTVGDGWEPSQAGAFIKFGGVDPSFTVSSIFFFEDISDLELNHTVEMSCLTGWEGEDSVDASEASCFPGSYDLTSVDGGLERTITGTAITPNYWMLNPLMAKALVEDSYMSCNTEMTIIEDSSGAYGQVTLLDKFEDECGYLSVQLVEPCSVTEATLIRTDVPWNAQIDEKHFAVHTLEDGTTAILFNRNLVGQNVRISYPREMYGEVVEISKHNLENAPRVRITREIEQTDGDIIIFQYDNVLITSFSDSVSNEGHAEFSLGINIQPDEDGKFGRRIRVLHNRVLEAHIPEAIAPGA